MRFLTFVLAAIVFGAARSWPHLATSTDGVLTRQLYPRAEEHGATTKVGPSRAGWAEVSEPISFKKQPLDLSEEHTKLSKRSSPLNKLSPKQLEYVKGKVQGLMDELQKQKLGVSGCELVCIAVDLVLGSVSQRDCKAICDSDDNDDDDENRRNYNLKIQYTRLALDLRKELRESPKQVDTPSRQPRVSKDANLKRRLRDIQRRREELKRKRGPQHSTGDDDEAGEDGTGDGLDPNPYPGFSIRLGGSNQADLFAWPAIITGAGTAAAGLWGRMSGMWGGASAV